MISRATVLRNHLVSQLYWLDLVAGGGGVVGVGVVGIVVPVESVDHRPDLIALLLLLLSLCLGTVMAMVMVTSGELVVHSPSRVYVRVKSVDKRMGMVD